MWCFGAHFTGKVQAAKLELKKEDLLEDYSLLPALPSMFWKGRHPMTVGSPFSYACSALTILKYSETLDCE